MGTTKKGRGQRRSRRNRGNTSRTSRIPIHAWGRDHWSTLAYVASRCAGRGGVLDKRHMRCDPVRHPHYAHLNNTPPPTRLIEGTVTAHDDWDCVDDAIAAGLVESFGTGLYPVFGMTHAGREITQWQFEQERARLPWSKVPRSVWEPALRKGT